MSTETAAPVIEQAETTIVADAALEPARNFEAEARELGWKPAEEWPANARRPSTFLDAESFVKKRDEVAPYIERESKKWESRLNKQAKDFDTRLAKIDRVNRANYDREVAQYQSRITELEAAQDRAAEAGDKGEVRRLRAEINKTPLPVEPEEEQQSADDPQSMKAEWQAANPWYGVDDDLTAYATGYSQRLLEKSDGKLPLADNLKQTEAKVRAMFPAKFGGAPKPNGNGFAHVDGGSSLGNGAARSDPFGRLTPAEREIAKTDLAKYPKAYPNAAAWMKTYEGR